MSSFRDHFSSASDAYLQYRPQYPAALFDHLADLAPARQWAWDCGCGNGQASVALAQRFARVTATDASAAQIEHARAADNIDYHVSRAEEIAAPAASLDLITVAQAIHWFDHDSFFAAVDRCLKPGGILAAWGYMLMYTDTEFDDVVKHFHGEVVGPYWPPGREFLEHGYRRIPFPYPRLAAPEFEMRVDWQFEHVLGYLNTWSATKRYTQDTGENPVALMQEQFERAWGDTRQAKSVYWPLILYIGRKAND